MHLPQYIQHKMLEGEALQRKLAYWRFKDMRLVFTNGCFDILHAGHIHYLTEAAAMGDVLVVGLNTDDSVRRLKGKDRPINNQDARANVLASLACIDAVVLFDEDTPENLIRLIKPHVLVKGNDYKIEEIAGYEVVLENGGQVVTLHLLPGYSTTSIFEKLNF